MKATLVNYTPNALDLLLMTKATRLSRDVREEVPNWTDEKKKAELDYMLGTIESSWEFISYVFFIEGVSRAFTHQLVRSRHASFAQQSQRTVDMTNFEFVTPATIGAEFPPDRLTDAFIRAMDQADFSYQELIGAGAAPQDARSVLPEATATNIFVGVNLRTLSEMAKKRLCYRTQGEYQQAFRAMRDSVLQVHPWTDKFLRVHCASTGVCCFPNFKECPIKPGIFNPDTGRRWDDKRIPDMCLQGTEPMRPLTKDEIQALWEATSFEAVPKQMRKGES